MAGMATSENTVWLLIRHPEIGRTEAAEVFRRRWLGSSVRDVGAASPPWAMLVEDVVELARARRGVEPVRIVVLAQQVHRQPDASWHATFPVEPMPVLL